MKLGGVDLFETVKGTVKEVMDDDVTGLSAELAYRFFLALFPFFIFLAALGGLIASMLNIANPADRVVNLLSDHVPADAAAVIRRQLQGVIESRSPGLLSFGIVAAIWTASSGVRSMMKAMNRAYDVEETRSFWKKYVVSIALTLLAGAFIVGAFILLVAGQFLTGEAAEAVGLVGAWQTVLGLARWPAALLLVIATMAFVYWAVPNIGLPFKWITPGAVLFTAVWLVATLLFGWYVANFGSYNATYGTLGGVVVLLLWFYLTSFIMLVGAELNAVVDEQIDPETLHQKQQEKRNEATAEQGRQPEHRAPRLAGSGRPVAQPTRIPPPGITARTLGAISTLAFLLGWRLGKVRGDKNGRHPSRERFQRRLHEG